MSIFLFPVEQQERKQGTVTCHCTTALATTSNTEMTADGSEEHPALKTPAIPAFTAIFPCNTASPEAARAGGGSRNRWGAEKHRNLSSSSLLQKYPAQMATWKHRRTQILVPGTGKEAGQPAAFALADSPVSNKR